MKENPLFQYLYVFYTFVFAMHIANIFIGNETLNYIIGVLALLMLAISFGRASRLFQILSASFLLVGAYLFWTTGESVLAIPSIMTSNLSLLTLLCMLPWMNSVVRSGRFDSSLNTLMKVNVSDLGKLYVRGSGTTLTLAAFLNLSAATISQEVLKENLAHLDNKVKNAFISTSTLRGFSLALLWSPLEILVALPIFLTGVSYVEILPWVLLIAVIAFTLDAIWGRYHFKKYTYETAEMAEQEEVSTKGLKGKIFHLACALVLFLALVIIGGTLFEIDFILTVTLLIFPFTLVWSIVMKRLRSFWAIGWNTWKMKTNTMQNFIILFISLSFFSYSISSAAFLEVIQQPILYVSEYPLLVFFVIQFLFIALSMFGIHPVATLGILGSLITTLLTVYNPLSIAIVLVTSSIATLTVGTYGLVVTLTAISLEQSPYRITIINLAYAFIFGSIGTLVAYLLL